MIVLGQYGVERWNAADDEYLIPPDPPQIRAVAEELPKILAHWIWPRPESRTRVGRLRSIPARCRIRSLDRALRCDR